MENRVEMSAYVSDRVPPRRASTARGEGFRTLSLDGRGVTLKAKRTAWLKKKSLCPNSVRWVQARPGNADVTHVGSRTGREMISPFASMKYCAWLTRTDSSAHPDFKQKVCADYLVMKTGTVWFG